MDMKLKWEITYIIEPQLRHNENIDGINFCVDDDGATKVTYEFETNSFDEKLSQRKFEYEYAEETKSDEFKEKIKKLLLARMVNNRSFQQIKITKTSNPKLINREELEKLGTTLRRKIMNALVASWDILDTNDSLSEAVILFDGNINDTVIKIADWIEKSTHQSNYIEKFRYSWSSFNALFSFYDSIHGIPLRTEVEKINKIINDLLTDMDIIKIARDNNQIFLNLTRYALQNRNGTINFSQELRSAINSPLPDHQKIVELSTRCVYEIRNKLFHEGPLATDALAKAEDGYRTRIDCVSEARTNHNLIRGWTSPVSQRK
jgi:hypothetical protein